MPTLRPAALVVLAFIVAASAAVAQQPPGPPPFERLDRDGDGKLSREELPPGVRNAFDRIDANGDGSISHEEDDTFRRRLNRIGAEQARLPENVEVKLDLSYAGTDHARQRLDLYLPKERKTDDPLPVVAYIHGGAWLAGDKRGAGGRVARFAATGEYVGVSIGYRLSRDAIWPAQIHDCKAAIRWLRGHAEEYNLDPDRIAVMGSSAGGHLVAMLGTSGGVTELEGDLGDFDDRPSAVTCVIDEFGPSNMQTIGDFPSQLDHKAANSPESLLVGGPITEKTDAARSASPVTYIDAKDPPFLIIHGDNDQVVPYPQSVELHEKLTQAGVPSLFITVEGGGHGGFASSEVDRRIGQFLTRHLKGEEVEIAEGAVKQGERAANRE
jgi:acetyl esterase/lipase